MANWNSDPATLASASSEMDADSFAASWVAELFVILPEASTAVLLLRGEDGVLKPRAALPAKSQLSDAVKSAAARVAERGKPVLSAAGATEFVIGASVQQDGAAAVAVASINCDTSEDAQRALAALKAALGRVEAWLLRNAQHHSEVGSQDGSALVLMARALEGHSFRDAAQRAATEMAQTSGADRIGIARARRGGARLEALSHAADVKKRSDSSDLIAAAADEALDQGVPLTWPDTDGNATTRASLAALARHSGAAGIAVVPMGDAEDQWGAIVAEFTFAEDAPRSVAQLDIAGAALAPLLDIKRREDRWLPRRTWDGLIAALSYLFGPAALGWKVLALALLAAAVFMGTYRSALRVTADGALVSEARVIIAAPFDGFLSERIAEAGAFVSRGDVLLALDARELTLEKLRYEASRSQKEIERDAAVSERDRTRLSVLSAEIAEISAQLALTEAQLEAGRLRAPFDGVVSSDLTTGKIGAPVGRGEELMQVAPLRDVSLRLYVPDAEIDRIAIGQSGQIRLAAFPDIPLAFDVQVVTPLTEPREGTNAFVVTARLTDETLPEITLGMEGIAKIDVDHDLWVKGWGVPLYERLRLALWSWWP